MFNKGKEVQKEFLNSDLRNFIRKGNTNGDLFGIEIELEGQRVTWRGQDDRILADWTPEQDGSLRNNPGPPQEWIFKNPVDYDTSVKRVHSLFDYLEERKAKINCSNRTSVHVHFNMGDKAVYQVVNTYILFTILEDILDNFCGEDRNGNLFCLSSRRAEEQYRWFKNACTKFFNFNDFGPDNRYCSLNIASLHKFGSIEFRGMRGLDNRQDVLDWLQILQELTNYACYKMRDPAQLIADISIETPLGFIRKVFSEKSVKLLTQDVDDHYLFASVYEGLRLVQPLCFELSSFYQEIEFRGPDFWANAKKNSKKKASDR